jgi:hypothetical protein
MCLSSVPLRSVTLRHALIGSCIAMLFIASCMLPLQLRICMFVCIRFWGVACGSFPVDSSNTVTVTPADKFFIVIFHTSAVDIFP